MSSTLEQKADEVIASVKGYVARAVAGINERLAVFEAQLKAIPAGPKGDTGDRGEPGPIGPAGESIVGPQGDPGPRGEPGESVVGPSGSKGDPGESIQGPKGDPGDRGPDGLSAYEVAKAAGFVGTATEWLGALVGKDGAPGSKGDPGESIKGDPGADGLSAYQLAAKAGFAGTEAQWLASLVGKDAAPLDADAVAKSVLAQIPVPKNGDRGDPGRDGREGKNGTNGRDGRDALEIDILPAIDETRTYQRNTFATHKGGIWLARSETRGMEGWDCIVRGIADETELTEDDGRTIKRTTVYSDGRTFERVIKTAAMLYREVWREGEFERGDTVTYHGSLWHAQAKTKATPGTSPEWKLCAKKGTDGKDGKNGPKGDRGAEGRAGKDLTQLGPDGAKW
jgi:hypothetical protein